MDVIRRGCKNPTHKLMDGVDSLWSIRPSLPILEDHNFTHSAYFCSHSGSGSNSWILIYLFYCHSFQSIHSQKKNSWFDVSGQIYFRQNWTSVGLGQWSGRISWSTKKDMALMSLVAMPEIVIVRKKQKNHLMKLTTGQWDFRFPWYSGNNWKRFHTLESITQESRELVDGDPFGFFFFCQEVIDFLFLWL